MKKLIIIRHGEYDDEGNLSGYGEDQIKALAAKIEREVPKTQGTLILSSTAPRARQSADVLSHVLGISMELHAILWSDNDHMENFDAVLALIQERRNDQEVIILVTHKEYGEDFPQFFGARELGVHWDTMWPEYAEGCIIDCEGKTVSRITYHPE